MRSLGFFTVTITTGKNSAKYPLEPGIIRLQLPAVIFCFPKSKVSIYEFIYRKETL